MNTRDIEAELERERAERVRLESELNDATRVVAALVLRDGGHTSIGLREMTVGYRTITTTPNVLTGGLDIEVTP